ncbi:lipid kinase YegS [Sphingobium scionense]|jgi:lipid kinase YegS|uniref:Lipid kinase YegS n=1 Tax=Sphingobium yanoikuyae TaxID=13690 RepID=A0A6P1GE49_SPHYA|nr:lipid kinase YegS [Sphingobium yanoikuyae]QHD66658.1 lipid kinase YegS [Sphingobium yanoikuyae]
MKRLRLILHGKIAQDERVRAAVRSVRQDGHQVSVRVTWEAGDAARLTREAVAEARRGEIDRIVAGGGDGTVDEVFVTAHRSGDFGECSFGILPLGTANDFARSVGLRVDDMSACLRLIVNKPAMRIDLGLLGERPFVNVVTGGFGARVTAETDPALKKSLGGLAYLLTGVSRAREFQPCRGRFRAEGFAWEGMFLALAIGNGRQAGGGIPLCPDALIDDGLLDLLIVPKIDLTAGREAMTVRAHSPWIEFEADEDVSISIDGEPDQVRGFRAECRSRALPVHLGHDLLLTGRR